MSTRLLLFLLISLSALTCPLVYLSVPTCLPVNPSALTSPTRLVKRCWPCHRLVEAVYLATRLPRSRTGGYLLRLSMPSLPAIHHPPPPDALPGWANYTSLLLFGIEKCNDLIGRISISLASSSSPYFSFPSYLFPSPLNFILYPFPSFNKNS